MTDRLTRRTIMLGLASAAASTSLPAVAAEPPEGHGIEREGATLTRFATGLPGAEMTGLFITADGQFFFNVQHPDVDGFVPSTTTRSTGRHDAFPTG